MNNQPGATRTILDYYAAFNTFEVRAILPYFHEPTLLMGPQGAFAAPTHDVLAPVLTTVIESLRARGFARSELIVRRVDYLSASTNLVTGVAIRYMGDGQELERVGVTYVLHNADSRWKIAVLIVHDPGEVAVAPLEPVINQPSPLTTDPMRKGFGRRRSRNCRLQIADCRLWITRMG